MLTRTGKWSPLKVRDMKLAKSQSHKQTLIALARKLAAVYIGSFPMAGGLLAIGACLSTFTRRRVIAFVLTVAACCGLMWLGVQSGLH